MSTPRYLLSPCCGAYVVAPVAVTVRGDGSPSRSITDSAASIRAQVLMGAAHLLADTEDAHCSECCRPVDIGAVRAS